MALYTVFAYKRRRPASYASTMDALTAAAHLQPEQVTRVVRRSRRTTIAAHAISTATAAYDASQQVALRERRATFLNGYVVEPTGPVRPRTAADIDAAMADGVDWSDVDGWAGEYSACHVDDRGVVTAWSDLHRAQSVFYLDTPDLFAVSTRPSLLRLLAGGRELDAKGAAVMSATGILFGSRTVHGDVLAVPQGAAVRWDGDEVRLVRRGAIVDARLDGAIDAADPAVLPLLDDGIEQTVRTLQLTTSGESDSIRLGLTGGKDSRTILALCLAHGLGPRLDTFTRGEADHPDVVVARMVAERAGVPHRVVALPPIAADPAAATPAEFFARVERHVFQSDGLLGAFDTVGGDRTGTNYTVNGHMVTILKGFGKKAAPTERVGALEVVEHGSAFDPLRLLTPWARQTVAAGLDTRFDELLTRGYELADLPDLFWYEHRLPNWLSASRQSNTFINTGMSPMGEAPLARLAMRASAAQRRMQLIHFLLLRRTAPQLLDVPFAMQTWSAQLPGAPVVEPVRPPRRPTGVLPPGANWQFAINNAPVRDELLAVARSVESDSPLWRAVDRERVLARLAGPAFERRELSSVFGVVAMVLHTTDRTDHPKIAVSRAASPPEPYAFEPPVLRRRGLLGGRGDVPDADSWAEV